uniref:Uncharacterized protein n=1 Tax=Timema genevievae TaxID=629358 RepID=A0A7R9PGA2_TIMGE|nr:unnamed protein product [Timema genevievae]
MNASHVFLLLLANPAWCWITWYSSTKKDVSVEGAAQATNAVRNDATKEERRANLTLINKGVLSYHPSRISDKDIWIRRVDFKGNVPALVWRGNE